MEVQDSIAWLGKPMPGLEHRDQFPSYIRQLMVMVQYPDVQYTDTRVEVRPAQANHSRTLYARVGTDNGVGSIQASQYPYGVANSETVGP